MRLQRERKIAFFCRETPGKREKRKDRQERKVTRRQQRKSENTRDKQKEKERGRGKILEKDQMRRAEERLKRRMFRQGKKKEESKKESRVVFSSSIQPSFPLLSLSPLSPLLSTQKRPA